MFSTLARFASTESKAAGTALMLPFFITSFAIIGVRHACFG
jgi:hypothetical protein